MDLLSSIFVELLRVLDGLLFLYFWIVIVSAILTWVNPDPYNQIVRILRSLTEPVFQKVRTWLPFLNFGGVDLSPIVVLIGIGILRRGVIQYFIMQAQVGTM